MEDTPKIRSAHFSAYKFEDMDSLKFDAKEYSKMKHGSKAISRKYGVELAKRFLCSHEFIGLMPEIYGKEIIVCSAPWKNIGVASTHIKDYFLSKFNPTWGKHNPPLIDLKVHRAHSYSSDYGSMDKEARDEAITADDFHIDKEFIRGKILFFIDDVKITGAHERRIQKLLEVAEFEGLVVFLYFAEFTGDGTADIENELNYAFVKSIMNINSIIRNDEFIFNTRVVKFILNAPPEDFKIFINFQDEAFQLNLIKEATGNSYHKDPAYIENYKYLESLI